MPGLAEDFLHWLYRCSRAWISDGYEFCMKLCHLALSLTLFFCFSILFLPLSHLNAADSVSSDEEFTFSDEEESDGVTAEHYETLVS